MPKNASIECVSGPGAELGEGAYWHAGEQALFWVDITQMQLHALDPSSGRSRTWQFDEHIGFGAPLNSDDLVVALSTGFFRVCRKTGRRERLSLVNPKSMAHRFNEAAVDPIGRLIAGTGPLAGPSRSDDRGTFFALDPRLDGIPLIAGFHTPNGLAFSPDRKVAYVSDSFPPVRRIWTWAYDPASCGWSNKRLFFDTAGQKGRPDGAAVDCEGCYWMAAVSGGQLMRLTPEGKVDLVIDMPVERPSNIAFGGARLDTIFVTSIALHLTPGWPQPEAGCVFAVRVPGIQGHPVPPVSLRPGS